MVEVEKKVKESEPEMVLIAADHQSGSVGVEKTALRLNIKCNILY